MAASSEWPWQSLAQAAAAVKAGAVSPVELTRACLERIERVDPVVHAFVSVDAEHALQEAQRAGREIKAGHYRGPLHGIPIGLKDNYDTTGVATRNGSRVFADRMPAQDATVWARLKEAGAVLLGKTTMSEAAWGVDFPPVRNPWACSSWAGRSTRRRCCVPATPIKRPRAGTRGGRRIPSRGQADARGGAPMSDWKLDRQNAYVPDVIPDSDLAMYRKANFGHPIGWGRKAGIVVVDMTRAFVEDRFAPGSARMGQAALRGIARLLEVARPMGIPVRFTKMVAFRNRTEAGRWYDSCPGIFGRPDDLAAHESAAIPPAIAPRPDEPVIVKGKPSAFFGTQLHSMLTYHNVDTLIITGMVTSGCVRATVDDAFSYDYRVIIPEECVADRAEVPHRVNLFDMEMISADVVPLDEALKHLLCRGEWTWAPQKCSGMLSAA